MNKEKEEKKGFWASLFTPKSCCCGSQIEEIKTEVEDSDIQKEEIPEEDGDAISGNGGD